MRCWSVTDESCLAPGLSFARDSDPSFKVEALEMLLPSVYKWNFWNDRLIGAIELSWCDRMGFVFDLFD